jgi:hypothetical protein
VIRTDRVIPAVAGDLVPRGIWREDIPVIMAAENGEFVKPRCADPLETQDYLCITCKYYLKNEANMEMHTETGVHVIARVCLLHGAEEP